MFYISLVTRGLFLVLVSFNACYGIAQIAFLSKKQMLEDLQFLKSNIEKYHPGLGRFRDTDFHSCYDSLIQVLPYSLPCNDFAPSHGAFRVM